MPNQVDLTRYDHISPPRDKHDIVLYHYGSTSHFEDLLDPEFTKGIDKVFDAYPNARIRMVGAMIPELKNRWGMRYEHAFGHQDVYTWIADRFRTYIDDADIMVVPLLDQIYNRCKSDIKFLETASAKKAGVWAMVRPYTETIENGKTGFLAQRAEDWFGHIKTLIEDKEKRREIGENAYRYIKANRQIQDHVKEYADFFKKILKLGS